MRAELTVPQVFEPGARVRAGRDGASFILEEKRDGLWTIGGMSYDDEALAAHFQVVAPATRPGQRWVGAALSVSMGSNRNVCFSAEWLLERELSFAGPADAAPATLRASEAAAVEPAPWTRAAARRLITETIASAKPRRPGAFISAMCSMAERRIPSAELIGSTAKALHALEAALPEHGIVADWQVERARVRAEDVFRSAAQLEHVPTRVREAFEMYVARRN